MNRANFDVYKNVKYVSIKFKNIVIDAFKKK